LKFVEKVVILENKRPGAVPLSILVKKYEKTDFDVHQAVQTKIDTKEQVAMIFCSSGTTGMPKGVLTTQGNMIACMQGFRNFQPYIEDLHKISVIALNIAPWFHVLGLLSMFMFACSRGCPFIFLPSFDEETFYKTIEVMITSNGKIDSLQFLTFLFNLLADLQS
jgi:4-coumarate--CoA ligase